MKIAICFYGVLYGDAGRPYDIRHCWPNLSRMVVEPFKAKQSRREGVGPLVSENEVDILLSTYKVDDEIIEKEIYEMIKPNHTQISDMAGSNSKTTKLASFKLLENKNYDFVILTRTDLHFSEIVVNMDIDYNKFNFLFHEKSDKSKNLTCDNFYAWPFNITKEVKKSFEDCPILNKHDTHQLYGTLIKNIPIESVHYIAGEEKHLSDVNKYFTICKSGYGSDKIDHGMHEDVMKRFNYKK
jgi:hypothetical protein